MPFKRTLSRRCGGDEMAGTDGPEVESPHGLKPCPVPQSPGLLPDCIQPVVMGARPNLVLNGALSAAFTLALWRARQPAP